MLLSLHRSFVFLLFLLFHFFTSFFMNNCSIGTNEVFQSLPQMPFRPPGHTFIYLTFILAEMQNLFFRGDPVVAGNVVK